MNFHFLTKWVPLLQYSWNWRFILSQVSWGVHGMGKHFEGGDVKDGMPLILVPTCYGLGLNLFEAKLLDALPDTKLLTAQGCWVFFMRYHLHHYNFYSLNLLPTENAYPTKKDVLIFLPRWYILALFSLLHWLLKSYQWNQCGDVGWLMGFRLCILLGSCYLLKNVYSHHHYAKTC